MYVTYVRHHWSLVCVFLMGHQYIVVRLDPISAEMDQNTQSILDHLKRATTKGPCHASTGTLQEDIMLDITVPHSPDLQDCGLRVLQYQKIIGTAVARQPDILDGPPIRIQEFLRTEVLPQLRLVNVASTDSYYYTLRTAIRQHL